MAITLVAIFLGYHANWVRQRRAALSPAAESGMAIYATDGEPIDPFADSDPEPQKPSPGPGLLRLFGEHGYTHITITFGPERSVPQRREFTAVEQAKVDRIRQLFPEAKVHAFAYEPLHKKPRQKAPPPEARPD